GCPPAERLLALRSTQAGRFAAPVSPRRNTSSALSYWETAWTFGPMHSKTGTGSSCASAASNGDEDGSQFPRKTRRPQQQRSPSCVSPSVPTIQTWPIRPLHVASRRRDATECPVAALRQSLLAPVSAYTRAD